VLKILRVSVPYLPGIWYEALHGHDNEVVISIFLKHTYRYRVIHLVPDAAVAHIAEDSLPFISGSSLALQFQIRFICLSNESF
jgi:hypothetical protein